MSVQVDWNFISALISPLVSVLSIEINSKIQEYSNSLHHISPDENLLSTAIDLSSVHVDFNSIRFVSTQEENRSMEKEPLNGTLDSLFSVLFDSAGTIQKISDSGCFFKILNICHPDSIFFDYLKDSQETALLKKDGFILSFQKPALNTTSPDVKPVNSMQLNADENQSKPKFIHSFVPNSIQNKNDSIWPMNSKSFSKLSTAIRDWSLQGFKKTLSAKLIEGRSISSDTLSSTLPSSPLDIQVELRINLLIDCDIVAKGNPGIDIPGFEITSLISLPIEATLSSIILDLPISIAIIGIEDALNDAGKDKKISIFVSMSNQESNNTPFISLKLATEIGDKNVKPPLKLAKKIERFLEEVIDSILKEKLGLPNCLKLEIENFSKFLNP